MLQCALCIDVCSKTSLSNSTLGSLQVQRDILLTVSNILGIQPEELLTGQLNAMSSTRLDTSSTNTVYYTGILY